MEKQDLIKSLEQEVIFLTLKDNNPKGSLSYIKLFLLKRQLKQLKL